jgi:nitronate monooxygenase
VGTLALVPQIVDAVRVPVVASGGIADGRGLAAALALGAAGVLLGTRFVVTVESQAPEFWKRAILDGDADATTVTDVFTGLHARVVRNRFWEEYVASKAPVLPPLLQRNAAQDIYAAATRADAPEYFTLYSGQGLGLVRDLPGAGDVVRAIAREAADVVSRLTRAEGADPGLTAPALPR